MKDQPIEEFFPKRIVFRGEQVGPAEEKLKSAFTECLYRNGALGKAYLAKVDYEHPEASGVALCLAINSPKILDLKKQLGSLFVAEFRSTEFLDIILLSPDQIVRIEQVCAPFYSRTK